MKVPSCTFGQLKTSANSFHGRRLWERSLKEKLENEVHYHHVYGVQERLRKPKRGMREIMSVPADCGARNENKRTTVDLMLAGPDQYFIERLDIRVHVGRWSERSPARV